MAISANYPSPVYVNGYACMNCAQVAEAKKGVNPADVQPGAPPGTPATSSTQQSPAVVFGGSLAGGSSTAGSPTGSPSSNPTFAMSSSPGALLSVSA